MEEKKSKLWFFEQFDLLKEVPDRIMDMLGEHSVLRATSKKEPIYLQNEATGNSGDNDFRDLAFSDARR
jgi:hypothetical protein